MVDSSRHKGQFLKPPFSRPLSHIYFAHLSRTFSSQGIFPPLRIRSAARQILDQDAIHSSTPQRVVSNGPFSAVVTRECVQCDLRYRNYFEVIVPRGPRNEPCGCSDGADRTLWMAFAIKSDCAV
ncbi:hypothetical protein CEXT_320171 [Caerostris extrusa]|uniref:Uncharacterized protein n=1 Tax=Caerostris extrusa TaxID=172846 RepID=A0AAV4X0S1_CAEEX|nr:hypothetical protein CEXT_320171 [Caerostris extrusa]